MKIITADERLAEEGGAKILIVGPSGVGKTSLLRTMAAEMLSSTLFVDVEAGDIAVADLPVASVRPRTWVECRDLACVLGGPNPALPANVAYSEAHYNETMKNSAFAQFTGYQILFVDSLTAAGRLCFTWAEQQPEAFTDRGRKDLRAIYGLHARSMLGWLNQLQHARGRTVIFVAVLEKVKEAAMPFDYTDAPPPSFDLIPDGTVATVSIHIRAGNVGEDGMLKRSREGDCEMLDLELTVVDGPYKGRKFWHNLLLVGTTDGQKKMAAGNLGVLKAILDSALGLKPKDGSAEARAARTVSVKWFDGKSFIAKIGEEKGGPRKDGSGNYPDKNILASVITPDKSDWHPVEQPPPFNGGGGGAAPTPSAPAAPVERPGWAR